MKGKRAATFIMIAIVAVIMVFAALLINHTTIFQEGNPLPVFKGIWQLTVNGAPYAQIKEDPATYITKTGKHDELFALVEETYGVKFKETMGEGYAFEGEGKRVAAVDRQYSRSFQIWKITEE